MELYTSRQVSDSFEEEITTFMELDDPGETDFIGIDPGFSSMGSVEGTYILDIPKNTLTIKFKKDSINTSRLCGEDEIYVQNILEYNRMVRSWKYHQFEEKLPGGKRPQSTMVIIEEQYLLPKPNSAWYRSINLLLLQAILWTNFENDRYNSYMCTFVKPSGFKKRMGLAKGNRNQNKKAAMKWVKRMLHVDVDQHAADAMLVAYKGILQGFRKDYPNLKIKLLLV